MRLDNAWGQRSKASTVNKSATRLRGFIAWASRRGWCRGDLLDGFTKVKADPRRDFLYLSAGELLRVLDETQHPRDRALLAAGMNTGLRASELVAIRLRDIDMEQGEFYAVIQKTNDSDLFPISADLAAEWRRWLTYYTETVGPLAGDMLMFPAKEGFRYGQDRKLHQGLVFPHRRMTHPEWVLQRALRRLGYSEEQLLGEGMHTLRRSVGRLYFDSIRGEGYDFALKETAAFLHHRHTSTTEDYLGISVERDMRNLRLKGKPFLSAMIQQPGSVVRLEGVL